MKKIFGIITLLVILICSYFIVSSKFNQIGLDTSDYQIELISNDLKEAEDFVFDKEGNIYVSKKNKLIKIKKDNSKEVVFEEKGITIMDIAYLNGEILYLYDDKMNSYNLETKRHKLIIDSIPTDGDYKDNKILVKDQDIYLTVGARTNSGVVGEDNKWRGNGKHDLSSEELEFNNITFKGTSPYSPYKKVFSNERKSKESKIGNASIIKINIKTKEIKLIASGIRNVEGIDFDSSNKIYMTVGGIEYRGSRPLFGDTDYLYQLEEGSWYGWPDYSGGDPVNSVRFRKEGKEKQNFLLKNHNKTPKAPLYQHKDINSLGAMAVDKSGKIETKDSFFIYDKLTENIINLRKEGEQKNILNLKGADVEKIIAKDENLYVLDKRNGLILKIYNRNNRSVITEQIKIMSVILVIMTITIMLLFLLVRRLYK